MTETVPTEERREDTSALIREANQRTANQLSMVVGMIQAQIAALRAGPKMLPHEAAGEILRETAGKIVSIAHLHRRLAEHSSDTAIDANDLLIGNIHEMGTSLSFADRLHVRRTASSTCVVSTEQAQTLSLIVGEIVMNAIKHAHPTGLPVEMNVACAPSGDGTITLKICDDGVGLPEGFDTAHDGGVGFNLIRTLAQSLQAELLIETDELGLCIQIILPADAGHSSAR